MKKLGFGDLIVLMCSGLDIFFRKCVNDRLRLCSLDRNNPLCLVDLLTKIFFLLFCPVVRLVILKVRIVLVLAEGKGLWKGSCTRSILQFKSIDISDDDVDRSTFVACWFKSKFA